MFSGWRLGCMELRHISRPAFLLSTLDLRLIAHYQVVGVFGVWEIGNEGRKRSH